jgi:hypothetical protein
MDIYESALVRSDVCSHQWDTMRENFARSIRKQLQMKVSMDFCAYTTIMRTNCGRDTINVFHSNQFLVAQIPYYHQPSGIALYAPPILSAATAVRSRRASRVIVVDLLNPRSRGASRNPRKCYVSHASSIRTGTVSMVQLLVLREGSAIMYWSPHRH